MFNSNNIRRRVITHIETKIADGQAEYNEGAKREDQYVAEATRALHEAAKRNKATLEENIITKIIG